MAELKRGTFAVRRTRIPTRRYGSGVRLCRQSALSQPTRCSIPDGTEVHCFESQLGDIDAIAINKCRPNNLAGGFGAAVEVNSLGSRLQRSAFHLLKGAFRM